MKILTFFFKIYFLLFELLFINFPKGFGSGIKQGFFANRLASWPVVYDAMRDIIESNSNNR